MVATHTAAPPPVAMAKTPKPIMDTKLATAKDGDRCPYLSDKPTVANNEGSSSMIHFDSTTEQPVDGFKRAN